MTYPKRSQSLVFSLAAALSVLPTHAHACPKLEDATLSDTCVVGVKWEGRRGTWFNEDVVPELLYKLRAYPELQIQVEKFRMLDSLREKETADLRAATTKLQLANENLQKQSDLSAADARRARAEAASSSRWYKSPVLWGIAMFIAGAMIQDACCSGK